MNEILTTNKEAQKPIDRDSITKIAIRLYEAEHKGTDTIVLKNNRSILGVLDYFYNDLPKSLQTKYWDMAELAFNEIKIIDKHQLTWDEIKLEVCSASLFSEYNNMHSQEMDGQKQAGYHLLSEADKEPYRSTIRIAVQCIHPGTKFFTYKN